MESGKLREFSLESMPKGFAKEMQRFWKIFDTSVKEAKAETKRLGITTTESALYSSVEKNRAEIPLVSESGEE
jgi:hypothetical protein